MNILGKAMNLPIIGLDFTNNKIEDSLVAGTRFELVISGCLTAPSAVMSPAG